MPLVRAALTVFSATNFLLAWLLLVYCEWAKHSVNELLPRFYYLGKTIVHIAMAISLIALSVLACVWIALLACAIFRGNRGVNNSKRKIAWIDGRLLIVSLASYVAMVVSTCTVVMANAPCKFIPHIEGRGTGALIELDEEKGTGALLEPDDEGVEDHDGQR